MTSTASLSKPTRYWPQAGLQINKGIAQSSNRQAQQLCEGLPDIGLKQVCTPAKKITTDICTPSREVHFAGLTSSYGETATFAVLTAVLYHWSVQPWCWLSKFEGCNYNTGSAKAQTAAICNPPVSRSWSRSWSATSPSRRGMYACLKTSSSAEVAPSDEACRLHVSAVAECIVWDFYKSLLV